MGSEGGKKRASTLTPERRKEIAAAASKARWSKQAQPAVEVAPEPAPAPVARKAPKQPPMRPEFRKALASAVKRLDIAMGERMKAVRLIAALDAEIPYLAGVVRSLGGEVPHNVAVASGMMQLQSPGQQLMPVDPPPHLDPASPMFRAPALPTGPRAQGGAFGIIGDPEKIDENAFLSDPDNPASGGGFR
jgi:hypothetical protein